MSNDGGAAFPRQGQQHISHDKNPLDPYDGYGWLLDPQDGMTLRDYFAAKAMPHFFGTGSPESRARACYAEADAMLAARSKP